MNTESSTHTVSVVCVGDCWLLAHGALITVLECRDPITRHEKLFVGDEAGKILSVFWTGTGKPDGHFRPKYRKMSTRMIFPNDGDKLLFRVDNRSAKE